MRTAWKSGTVLETQSGTRYTITSSDESGGSAIVYFARSSASSIRAVLKEFFPLGSGREGWSRRNGAAVQDSVLTLPAGSKPLQECQQQLHDLAVYELDTSQAIAEHITGIWPARELLQVVEITEPDGTRWRPEPEDGGVLPCCILRMDDLNDRDGIWMKDLMNEAVFPQSPEHPLGNLQGVDTLHAVPPLTVSLAVVQHTLNLLYKIHQAGYLHGDINLGNLFLVLGPEGGEVTSVMTIDFGCSRKLTDGRTDFIRAEQLFTTPGFGAPEIWKYLDHGTSLQLTAAADVYSVGKLLQFLLNRDAANAYRMGLDLEPRLRKATLSQQKTNDKHLSADILRRINALLAGAAEEMPEKRSTVPEMLEQIVQLQRRLAPPAWQVSLALPPLNEGEVLGREADIETIKRRLCTDNTMVLHGFSGIGKTKLVTLLGHEWAWSNPYSQVYYAFFPGKMTDLVVGTLARNMDTVKLTVYDPQKQQEVPRAAEEIAGDVFRELNARMGPDDLLIVDNVDSDTMSWEEFVHERAPWGQDLFEALCSLQCKVIFVTRMDLSDAEGTAPYPVGKLAKEDLRALLRRYSSDARKRSNQELDRLIQLVDYHTMTVAMVSKTMEDSCLTLPEIYKELERGEYGSDAFVRIKGEKQGDYERRKIEGHLICLFRLSNFNEREQALLRYAQLIGENCGMYEKLFLTCCPHKTRAENTANIEALDHLVQMGYIQLKKEDDTKEATLNLHTLVRVVAKKVLMLTPEMCETFLQPMERFRGMLGVMPDDVDDLLDETGEAQIYESFLTASSLFSESDELVAACWKSFGLRWVAGRTIEMAKNEKAFSQMLELEQFFHDNAKHIQDPSREKVPCAARFCENLFYLADAVTLTQALLSGIDTKENLSIFLEIYPNFLPDFPMLNEDRMYWKEKRTFYGECALAALLRMEPVDENSIIALYTELSCRSDAAKKLDYAKQRLEFECAQGHSAAELAQANLNVAKAYDEVGESSKAEEYYKSCFELLEAMPSSADKTHIAIRLLNYSEWLKDNLRYQEALDYNRKLEKFVSDEGSLRMILEERAELYYHLERYNEFIALDDQLDNPWGFRLQRPHAYACAIRDAQLSGDLKRVSELEKQREKLNIPAVTLHPAPDWIR